MIKLYKIFLFVVLIVSLLTLTCKAQAVYFHHALFYLPDGSPFAETYMAIDGKYFPFFQTKEKRWQNKVSFVVKIKNDKGNEKVIQSYTVRGPEFSDTLHPPVFLDVQRYSLAQGNQTLIIQIQQDSSGRHSVPLYVKPNPCEYCFSGLEFLEKIVKSENKLSPFYKNGYEMYPYLVNYFPENVSNLRFYAEAYCFRPIQSIPEVIYRIRDADDGKVVKGFEKKVSWKNPQLPLPVIGGFDISALPTGNYYLELVMQTASDSVLSYSKHFFQRRNFFGKPLQDIASGKAVSLEKYLSGVHNKDTLQMMVEALYPISSEVEKQRQFNHLRSFEEQRVKEYLNHFWNRRAGDTVSSYQIFMEYMKRVYEANALFACGKQKGYNTEQGRVYLQYGRPSQVASQQNEANTYPYQIWHYYRAWDESLQRFVTNRRFVFVNTNIADNCYRLVHSDMRGEINNERWMFDVMKRFNDGIQNIDNNTPTESGNTQMKDLYQAPR